MRIKENVGVRHTSPHCQDQRPLHERVPEDAGPVERCGPGAHKHTDEVTNPVRHETLPGDNGQNGRENEVAENGNVESQ